MMNTSGRIGGWVPSGNTHLYDARVEYLQPPLMTSVEEYSTRIDTGISPTVNTEIVLDFSFVDNKGGHIVMSARTGSSAVNMVHPFFISKGKQEKYQTYLGNSGTTIYLIGLPTSKTRVIFNRFGDHHYIYDGEDIGTFSISGSNSYRKSNNNTLIMFGTSGYEPNYYTPNARIYYAKITNNGNVVREFIPVRFTNENGVSEGAMFDTVSQQLFRNIGNGEFQIGPDMYSGISIDSEVEYIESTGTQYIDTDILIGKGMTIDARIDTAFGGSVAAGKDEFYGYYDNSRYQIHDGANSAYTTYATPRPPTTIVQSGGLRTIYDGNTVTWSTLDGKQYTASLAGDTWTVDDTNQHFLLFAWRRGKTTQNNYKGKLWYLKLNRYGKNLLDVIPVRITNENGITEGALYDKVRRILLRNQGSGAFLIGPDKMTSTLNVGGGYNEPKINRQCEKVCSCFRADEWEVAA